ncbi:MULTISPECIES: hypothetical protein [Xenorhabdus]|uniref:hypothetical protein n=1 Tax=Xenorhabdus TaxID=626 RepID=UPI00064A70FC|nr:MULTISPECIES: hypothetical protein [Xenorhabdus]KLU17172.1 hypothetical protein AAY47_01795 [Xenorhabdus griffiniae]KOP32753.1 hypothetical protein AFK69_13665 [Xenorhabdus sp. GDc328]
MNKSVYLEKIESLEGFSTIKNDERQSVIDAGMDAMEHEFNRLTAEKFPYSPNAPCLEIHHIHTSDDGVSYDLVYMKDMARIKTDKPVTYMIGFNDHALVATVSDLEQKKVSEMFDLFVKAYRQQSDEEFIDLPLSVFAKAVQQREAYKSEKHVVLYRKAIANMPDYSNIKGSSNEALTFIKDYQGAEILPNLSSAIEIVLHANAFADNVINRSARLTSNAIAEVGMMKEQAVAYGLKTASSKIAEIQLRGSKLAGMAGMF